LLFVSLALPVFVLSAYFSFSWFVRSGVVTVPKLVGVTQEEAQSRLADLGLEPVPADPPERPSERFAAGLVVETYPAGGSLVKRGSKVAYVLSKGPERRLIPDLTGKEVEAARVQLRAEGLELGTVMAAFQPGIQAGRIFLQQPAAGREVPSGTAVRVLVAQEGGPELLRMPDLVSRRYEPVRQALERLGFRIGAVRFQPYEGVPPGTILQQEPQPGHPVLLRTPVRFVVAKEEGSPG
jgi:serine/threonine-protein kinase